MAIIGLGPGTDLAPIQDPAIETWGLTWDWRSSVFDRSYDIHDLSKYDPNTDETQRLIKAANELRETYPDILWDFARFPFEEVDKFCGRMGFESSIAYMLGHALYEGIRDISIWGVHCAGDSEYEDQRDNMLMLIGFARGLGATVFLQEGSRLRVPVRYYGR